MNTDRQPACPADSAWARLNTLLHTRHREILDREMHNERFIHLYGAGDYWTAFEQSACRLNRLFPDSEISVIRLDSCLFPIVMVAVSAHSLDAYSRRHIVREAEPDRRILSGPRLSRSEYLCWHIQALSFE